MTEGGKVMVVVVFLEEVEEERKVKPGNLEEQTTENLQTRNEAACVMVGFVRSTVIAVTQIKK